MRIPLFAWLALSLALFSLSGCHKVPNTTPRYNPAQCPLCNLEPGKCSYCRGAAACTFCRGTGKRVEGSRKKHYETVCPFCQGDAKCHYCKGSGKCHLCGGDGQWKHTGTGVPPAASPE